MIVIMKDTATLQQEQFIIERLNGMGFSVERTACAGFTILGVIGHWEDEDLELIRLLPGVHSVQTVEQTSAQPSMRRSAESYFDLFGLTGRERQIVCLLLEGYSNKEIASRWRISEWTVKEHLKHLFEKVGIHQRAALVAHVLRLSEN